MEADRASGAASAPTSLLIVAVVVAAAVGGALADCHPSGTAAVDPIYTALFAGVVTWAASRAPRGTLLWLGVCALALTRGRGWLVIPGVGAMLLAFGGVWTRRPHALLGALTGAVAVQVVLRWPPTSFHGATALAAFLATAPCVVGALLTLSKKVRRRVGWGALGLLSVAVVFSILAAVGALLAHSEINQGIDQAEGALSSISNGVTSSGAAQLRVASSDFASASHRADSWWTAGARLVPVVAQQRQAVGVASVVAQDVTATAAHQAAGIHYSKLRYSSGRFDLHQVSALSGPIGVVNGELTSAVSQLRSLQSQWLLGPVQTRLDTLDAKVVRAQASASLAAQLVQAAPSLLGGDGVRHYFVAFMTPAESRGLDGIIATYGELTADQGHLTLTRSGDVSQLNGALVRAGGGHLSGPADYLARYGAFQPQDHFQDLSYSPNLPTVANVIRQLYPQAGGGSIDGVLALDPFGLASLIGLSGPIEVPGLGQLTAANTADELIKGQYATFAANQQTVVQNYLQEALRIEFHQLTTGSLPGPRSLSEALNQDVRHGHIQFWSFDRSDQPVLRRLGLAGAFPAAHGHDVLALTTQNAANNKIDPYLQRSVADAVSYDPANGEVVSRVTITLHNEAPAQGLPSVVIGSYPGSGLPPGTNATWLTLYSPLGLHAAGVDGRRQAVSDVSEFGMHAYSEFVDIPPEGSVTVTFDLVGLTTPGPYRLTMRNQPMVLADRDTVRVRPDPGWRLTGSATWLPGHDSTEGHTFRFTRNG